MKTINLSITGIAFGVLLSAAATAQPFEPPVLAPKAQPQHQQVDIARIFAQSYHQAGRPRVAVYWNRQLSDSLASNYQDFDRHVTTHTDVGSDREDTTNTSFGNATLREKDNSQRTVEERTRGSRLTNADAARPQADESTAWRLESSYYDPLLAAGVRLIDRTVIMRTLDPSHGAQPDVQSVETRALLGKADYLLEVLMTGDDASPIGCRFRVAIKDVNTGEIVGLISTRAIPPPASVQTRFVATDAGFERQTISQTANLEDFAHRLAEETMFELVRSWDARNSAAVGK